MYKYIKVVISSLIIFILLFNIFFVLTFFAI